MSLKVLAVIPARWNSKRFIGKPIAKIKDLPMIVHVWNQTKKAKSITDIVVATDSEKIAAVCRQYNIAYQLTSSSHPTGTDRLVEVAKKISADIYVNVQGDEPLISPDSINTLVYNMQNALLEKNIHVFTGYISKLQENTKKVGALVYILPTTCHTVLAFSRHPLPYELCAPYSKYIHIGLSAFTKEALLQFSSWQQGPIEKAESIELMRYLEHGEKIGCIELKHPSISVDYPEDIKTVEQFL